MMTEWYHSSASQLAECSHMIHSPSGIWYMNSALQHDVGIALQERGSLQKIGNNAIWNTFQFRIPSHMLLT